MVKLQLLLKFINVRVKIGWDLPHIEVEFLVDGSVSRAFNVLGVNIARCHTAGHSICKKPSRLVHFYAVSCVWAYPTVAIRALECSWEIVIAWWTVFLAGDLICVEICAQYSVYIGRLVFKPILLRVELNAHFAREFLKRRMIVAVVDLDRDCVPILSLNLSRISSEVVPRWIRQILRVVVEAIKLQGEVDIEANDDQQAYQTSKTCVEWALTLVGKLHRNSKQVFRSHTRHNFCKKAHNLIKQINL